MIAAEGLAVGYGAGRAPVLHDVDARLDAGELVCLLGPNGAGKSTLLRTLVGLLPPQAGAVRLDGRPLTAFTARERARRLGVVLPEALPPSALRVDELVALGRHPHTGWHGRLGDRDRAVVAEALERVGIAALARRRAAHLSDGERQKAMIARALVQQPAVLVLDEPTAFLDLAARAEILALLRVLSRGDDDHAPRAILLSTHDLDLALRAADRVWLVDDGQLVHGAPEDLVLDGSLEAAFARPGLTFDRTAGAFRAPVPTRGEVSIEGDGDTALWTRRALTRRGWRIVDAATPSERHIVVSEDASPRWQVRTGEASSRHDSIASLLAALERGASGSVDGRQER